MDRALAKVSSFDSWSSAMLRQAHNNPDAKLCLGAYRFPRRRQQNTGIERFARGHLLLYEIKVCLCARAHTWAPLRV